MKKRNTQHPVASAVFAKRSLNSIKQVLVKDSSIPVIYWEEGCLFYGVEDTLWRKKTNDIFPKTLREGKGTHPLYVLQQSSYGIRVCPCSTKNWGKRPLRSIPKGFMLLYTGYIMEQTSYLVWSVPVAPLLFQETFERKPRFLGVCPPQCLHTEE